MNENNKVTALSSETRRKLRSSRILSLTSSDSSATVTSWLVTDELAERIATQLNGYTTDDGVLSRKDTAGSGPIINAARDVLSKAVVV